MDLHKVLAEMHAERERLKMIIDRLERMSKPADKSNSRKGMDAAARKAASLRMRTYWENRRKQETLVTQLANDPGN